MSLCHSFPLNREPERAHVRLGRVNGSRRLHRGGHAHHDCGACARITAPACRETIPYCASQRRRLLIWYRAGLFSSNVSSYYGADNACRWNAHRSVSWVPPPPRLTPPSLEPQSQGATQGRLLAWAAQLGYADEKSAPRPSPCLTRSVVRQSYRFHWLRISTDPTVSVKREACLQ